MSGPLPPYGGPGSSLGGLGNNTTAAQSLHHQQMLAQYHAMKRAAALGLWYPSQLTPPAPPPPELPAFARPDPSEPDTLGWRLWRWSEADRCLKSPHQETPWLSAELSVAQWSDDDAVRGVAGIHARLMPKNWRLIGWPSGDGSQVDGVSAVAVTGIVERWGRFVLGTTGWRAERVVIRELMAPSTEIGLAMEQIYPDAIVHYADQSEGVPSCKSVKSSELGKGNRAASQPLSPPSFQSLLPSANPSTPPPSQQNESEKTSRLDGLRRRLGL